MKISTLRTINQLEPLTEPHYQEGIIEHFYCGDLLSLVLKHARKPHTCLLTTNTSINVLGVAVMLDFPVVIFTSGERPSSEVIQKANIENIALFVTEFDGLTMYKEIMKYESTL